MITTNTVSDPAFVPETPSWPADPPADWLTFHLAHPGPGKAHPGDPNCAFYWAGKYHLHYIYKGADGFAFAHVSSTDLVHWTWHPTTLSPTTTGHGMWSGTGFVTKEGRPAIIYHGNLGGRLGGNQIAVAEDDELERWTRPMAIEPRVGPDQDGSVISTWDPDGWLEGDTYYAVFGGRRDEDGSKGKPATLHRSSDLITWEYVGLLMREDLPDAAEDTDISCPNLFEIGGKHMLLCISHNLGCRYYLGEWKNETFTPDFHARMNWNKWDVFAPESVLTPDGRRVMWAWCHLEEAPMTGIQSLPRELSLPIDGVLRIAPARELEVLRADECRERDVVVHLGTRHFVREISGDALELAVTIRPGSASRIGVVAHCDAHGGGGIPVAVDIAARTLSIGEVEAPFELAADETLTLRVFVDKYVVEAFANERQAVLSFHPHDPANVHVALFSDAGDATADVTGWRMNSIYSAH